MTCRSTILPGAAVAALIAGAAHAQDGAAPVHLGAIVFANLEPVEGERTGTTVTVVTEEDLDDAADLRVAEMLARLPGINITARGGLGTQTGLTLRGAGQNYITVLVDGIDVTDPSSVQTAYDFGRLTGAGLGRIEIVPGSQSALYGSSAVGGVIAITSVTAQEPGLHHRITAEYGSRETWQLSYGLTWQDARSDFALTLSQVATEGFSSAAESDGNTEPDGYVASRLAFNGGIDLEGGLRIGIAGFVDQSEGDYDSSFPISDADHLANVDSAGLRLSAEFATGAIDHELAATRYMIERRYLEGGPFASDTTYAGVRDGLSWQGATDIGAAGRIVFGLDWQSESYDQTGTYGELTADTQTAAAFAELTYAATADLDLSFTFRHDDHSRFGGFGTGRLALAWRPAPGWILRAQAGTGFRAPSNFELYSAYGNPGLQPETSRSIDLGIERQIGAEGFVRATLFRLEVDNLIDYSDKGTPDFGDDGYAQVAGISRRDGLEIVARVPMGDRITLGADYTWTDSSTNGTSSWASIPEHVYGLSLDAALTDRLEARLDLSRATDRPALPDYTVANAAVSYELRDGVAAYLRIENLFDEDYELVDGYGTPDRAFHVGIDARF